MSEINNSMVYLEEVIARRNETIAALRAENAELREERDSAIAHQSQLIEKRENAETELSTLWESMRWIPVGERLPEAGMTVLCCYKGVYNHRIAIFWKDAGGNRHFQCRDKGSQPATHWMPIPKPPEDSSDE